MTARAHGTPSGAQKVAIFLAALGEEAASLVLRQLSEREVESVAAELAKLHNVEPDTADKILAEIDELSEARPQVSAGDNFARKVVLRAMGEENGKTILQRIPALNRGNPTPIEALRTADPMLLATMLQEEHPQAVALLLSQLEPEQASAVIAKLPPEPATDVIRRMAQINQFAPDLAQTVSSVLHKRLQNFGERERRSYPGLRGAADIMNKLPAPTVAPLLEGLEREEPNLAIGIRNLMFTFEDLITVPEASLREWLTAVEKKTLALALKGASEEVSAHIMKGMSSRAATMLKEDIETLGPTRAKEIQKAQEEAVGVARQLESEGKLVLRADGDDEYVV